MCSRVLGLVQSVRMPSASLLYDARITIDMCTMLYARQFIFNHRQPPWVVHLRADASPQFGRDFLVIQADYIEYGANVSKTKITKRLLPIQSVGSRAAGSHQKLEKVLFSLTLESENDA